MGGQNVFCFHSISPVLVDFIFIDSAGSYECMRGLRDIMKISEIPGVPLKDSLTVYPSTSVTVQDLKFDTLQKMVRVPNNKLHKALTPLDALLGKTCARVNDVQKLVGSLSFLGKYIIPGRVLLRRLLDLICLSSLPNGNHTSINVSATYKRILKPISCFLTNLMGRLYCQMTYGYPRMLFTITDACQSAGYAGV